MLGLFTLQLNQIDYICMIGALHLIYNVTYNLSLCDEQQEGLPFLACATFVEVCLCVYLAEPLCQGPVLSHPLDD